MSRSRSHTMCIDYPQNETPWKPGARCVAMLVGMAPLLLLSSCSLFHPYLRTDRLMCENGTEQVGFLGSQTQCAPSSTAFAGRAELAVAAANDQRRRYLTAANNRYAFNSAVGVAIIGLSADAIYKGVSKTSQSALAAEAAGAAGLYGMDVWLHDKSTESTYIVGFQAITCTLLRSRAILLPTDEFADFKANVDRFEGEIDIVDKQLSTVQIEWNLGEEAGNTLETGEENNLKRETGNVVKTLARARKLLLTAQAFEAEIDKSGETIRDQVNLIVSNVSSQIAQSEPSITALKGVLGAFSDPSKGVADLQAVTLTPPGSTSPADQPPGGKPASSPKDKAAVGTPPATRPPSPPSALYQQRSRDRATLSGYVSDLYAAGRKLNVVLASAQNFYASTKRISACEPADSAPALEITPATLTEPVSPGAAVKFTVTGGTGIPAISLSGSTGATGDAKTPDLAVTVNGNSLVAAVTILPGASGTLTLIASDKGPPVQIARVTIDVEDASTKTKPTMKAVGGNQSVELSFTTPTVKSATLNGYTVTLTHGNTSPVTLEFADAKQGTKSTGGNTVTGAISSVAGSDTTIAIKGLTNETSYVIGLSGHFRSASDVVFENVTVTPTAK
jgi:hypothetical protein